MSKEYYIYGAYGKDGELLYIGYGKGNRYKHCNTGISSSKALNRYYFLNGENKCIKVEKLFENLSLDNAVHLELLCIQYLNPSCNVAGTFRNFSLVAKEYYEAYLEGDTESMEVLATDNPDFSEILNAIGIEEIKATSFHKTKSKAKYKKAVGIDKTSAKALRACKSLRLKKDCFYPYTELKAMVKEAYVNKGVDLTPKATDVKQAFNVKRARRNGVEGFVIGDKL